MNTPSFVHRASRLAVHLLFYGGLAVLIALPFLFYTKLPRYWPPFAALMLSGCCAEVILFNFMRMYKTLLSGNPFVDTNVRCLRHIAVVCVAIGVIFAVCFLGWPEVCQTAFFRIVTKYRFTLPGAVIGIFTIGCLFALTLKDIFKAAIAYKTENDWTV